MEEIASDKYKISTVVDCYINIRQGGASDKYKISTVVDVSSVAFGSVLQTNTKFLLL